MFIVVLTLVVTLLQAYVFWRAATVPVVRRHIRRGALALAGFGLWLLFVLAFFYGGQLTGPAGQALEALAMTWLGVLFLAGTALLATDVLTGFGLLWGRRAPTWRGFALAASGALSVVALVQALRPPVVTDYAVSLPGLPAESDGMVIVALSDLHLGPLLGTGWLQARIAQVEALRPDAVVVLGDVFEGHGRPDPALFAAWRRLTAPRGIWAVLGNHEFHGANHEAPAWFEEAGMRPLRDAWMPLRPGLALAGFEDPNGALGRPADGTLAKLLAGRPPGASVLLTHAPLPLETAAASRVGLILSGHTHGGQLWPFGYLVRWRFPLFAGRYQAAGSVVIVSRGTGFWGPPMRLWRPGEIVRITLRRTPSTP